VLGLILIEFCAETTTTFRVSEDAADGKQTESARIVVLIFDTEI